MGQILSAHDFRICIAPPSSLNLIVIRRQILKEELQKFPNVSTEKKETKAFAKDMTTPVSIGKENKDSAHQANLSVINHDAKKEQKQFPTPKSVPRLSVSSSGPSSTSPSLFRPPCGDSFFDDDSYLPSTLASFKECSVNKSPAVISLGNMSSERNISRASIQGTHNSLQILEASEPIEIHSDEDIDLFSTNLETFDPHPDKESHSVNNTNVAHGSCDTSAEESVPAFTGTSMLHFDTNISTCISF